MDYYLSSRGLGKNLTEFQKLFPKNKKTLFVQNAMDYSKDHKNLEKRLNHYMWLLEGLGLEPEQLDLRKYFGKKKALEKKMKSAGVIWVSGGNVFVLRQAMKLSGFDKILLKLSKKDDLLYGGASAGTCILAPSLRGIEIADSLKQNPYHVKTIWEGLGLIDYLPLPHYKARGWSRTIQRIIEYCLKHRIVFRVLKNGEVITIKKGKEKLLQ